MTKETFVKLINRYQDCLERLKDLSGEANASSDTLNVFTSPFENLFLEALLSEVENRDLVIWWLYKNGEKVIESNGAKHYLNTAEDLYDYIHNRWDPRFNRPKVLLDCDDVINDFTGYICKIHNLRTGANLSKDDFKTWELKNYIPEYKEIMTEEGFFEDIPQKNNSIAALKWLIDSAKYDVYIITACQSNQELQEKFNWFDKYLPDFNKNRIISCKEKEMIRGDVLVDDKVENLDLCAPFMKCIVLDMPSNKDCPYPRAKSLGDVIPYLEKWFYN